MVLPEVRLEPINLSSQQSSIEVVEEVCKEAEPKPLFCELPEDLKLSFSFAGGTASANIEHLNSPYIIVGTANTTIQTISGMARIIPSDNTDKISETQMRQSQKVLEKLLENKL